MILELFLGWKVLKLRDKFGKLDWEFEIDDIMMKFLFEGVVFCFLFDY